MRLPIPQKLRQQVGDALHEAYDEPSCAAVREALAPLMGHFHTTMPRVRWLTPHERRVRSGWSTLGMTFADGKIALTHPKHWPPRPDAEWLHTALHECWHYLFWVREEQKADAFADAFMQGVS